MVKNYNSKNIVLRKNIMIFDEVTFSLENETKELVMESIDSFQGKETLLSYTDFTQYKNIIKYMRFLKMELF